MAKLLYVIICSLAFCNAEMGRQRRWRMERRKKAAAKAAAERREREKNAPRDAESMKDKENLRPVYKFLGLEPPPAGADKTIKMHPTDIPWYDYIGRKDPATGEITCPWRRGRGKVPSGGSSGVQMAG